MATSSNSIDTQHPDYVCRIRQWQRCRDVLSGQDAVKERDGGRCYLPPTAGMWMDGMNNCEELGYRNYEAYKKRSLFYGYYAECVDLTLGMLWNKPPVIEGLKGTPLEYLETQATHEGESLERLLYRINEAQISTGRIGLLADMPAEETLGNPQPYISIYNEASIINWDASFTGQLSKESLNLVVLDESGPMRTDTFQWDEFTQYRVLTLGPVDTNEAFGTYRQAVFSETGPSVPSFDPSLLKAPTALGRTLDQIPFVFINANSTTSATQDPPLLSLADLVLHLYRLQADYSAELHGQTSATLVTKGLVKSPKDEKAPTRLGVGGHVDLGSNKEAEAYFLELSGKGLPELRQAVESTKQLARERSGEIVDQSSRGRESGNSLEQRISVRTATLHSIAQHGAEGLTKLLRVMGRWLGMTDEQIAKIKVVPNTVFAKAQFNSLDLKQTVESKLMGGALISLKSVHNFLVQRGFTTLSFEEMQSEWESEKDLMKKIQEQVAEGEELKAEAQAAANPQPVSPAAPKSNNPAPTSAE